MLVYTLLFTLEGRNPAENQYIDMFFIWLTFLHKNGGLQKSDIISILADQATIDFLNTTETFAQVSKGILANIEFHLIPQPKTLMEGCMQRYNETHGIFRECSLYLDLDILVCRSFQEIQTLPSNTFLACPEGELLSTDYGGHFFSHSVDLKWEPGYTSAVFAFTEGEETRSILKKIYSECESHKDEPFYTIDQPYFNKNIFTLKTKYTIPSDWVEDNIPIDERKNSTVFLNYCGEPGKGKIHFLKLLTQVCIEASTPLQLGALNPQAPEPAAAEAAPEAP